MLSLLEHQTNELLGDAKIIGVFSDKAGAGILKIAKERGIFSKVLPPSEYAADPALQINSSWIEEIKPLNPDLIILAGFMKILPKEFIDAFDSRIINLHPSLLPSFRGIDGIRQAWEAGVRITGCTIHWVSPELDAGPIIAQAPVRVMETDDLDSLASKIHAAEHTLLPIVVANLSLGLHPFP